MLVNVLHELLRVAIDVSTRTVLDYLVTDGYVSDVAGMWPMLGRIEEGTGFFCLGFGLPGKERFATR